MNSWSCLAGTLPTERLLCSLSRMFNLGNTNTESYTYPFQFDEVILQLRSLSTADLLAHELKGCQNRKFVTQLNPSNFLVSVDRASHLVCLVYLLFESCQWHGDLMQYYHSKLTTCECCTSSLFAEITLDRTCRTPLLPRRLFLSSVNTKWNLGSSHMTHWFNGQRTGAVQTQSLSVVKMAAKS